MIQSVHATISTCMPRRLLLYTTFMCILTSSGALHKHKNDFFASVASYTPLRQRLIQSYYFAHKHEINIRGKVNGCVLLSIYISLPSFPHTLAFCNFPCFLMVYIVILAWHVMPSQSEKGILLISEVKIEKKHLLKK